MKCTWPTPAFCVGTQHNLYSTGWRRGHCPTSTPDARYFALQWNIGFMLCASIPSGVSADLTLCTQGTVRAASRAWIEAVVQATWGDRHGAIAISYFCVSTSLKEPVALHATFSLWSVMEILIHNVKKTSSNGYGNVKGKITQTFWFIDTEKKRINHKMFWLIIAVILWH